MKDLRPSVAPRVRTARAAADEAAEVLGLGERTLGARARRPRARTSRAARASWLVTRSQSSSVTPSGWSMKRRTRSPPTTSASRTSTSGSTSASRASISVWIVLMSPPPIQKKAGSRPLPKGPTGREKLCVQSSTRRLCGGSCSTARGGDRACGRRRRGPVAIDAVVAALRVHVGGQRERLARLGGAPELHQRAAEAEERVVVGRRALDDRLELRARPARRRRSGSTRARAPRGSRSCPGRDRGPWRADRGLVEVPVLEQRHSSLIEVIDVVHGPEFRPAQARRERRPLRGGSAHQARRRPSRPERRVRARTAAPRRCARGGRLPAPP